MEDNNENLVKIYSYFVNEKMLIQMERDGEKITNDVIEQIGIQDVLKENHIFYKNKLVDYWHGKDYKIMVEVYVYDIDVLRAQKALEDFRKDFEEGEFIYDDQTSSNI